MMYGSASNGEYAKLATPLPAMAIMRQSHQLVDDVHAFKWWKRKEGQMVHLLPGEELSKLAPKFAPKCYPLPWAEWPVSEAIAALLLAAFLGRILTPADKKK